MLHVTDLYRPHNDPDDHWDLACAYSLVSEGSAELVGVFIDFPQPNRENDPDVLAVAQMNYLTSAPAPVMIGSPRWIEPEEADRPENELALGGIRTMLDLLRRSPRPVVISVLGSCRDVAIAGRIAPDLFAEKCAALYLNAGSGTPDPEKAKRLEWNVNLDPRGYAAIFDLPCPIYWMPCFHEVHPDPEDLFQVGEYGTFFRFRQGEILPELSDPLQNFFAYMFLHGRHLKGTGEREPNWLSYLLAGKDAEVHRRIRMMDRNMWCTGGFLHAVGETVTPQGKIVPLDSATDPVFTFDPVQVTCSADGVTRWKPGSASPPRFLFHVRDEQRYEAAMTAALRSMLLRGLG